jgi:hypothetical protein
MLWGIKLSYFGAVVPAPGVVPVWPPVVPDPEVALVPVPPVVPRGGVVLPVVLEPGAGSDVVLGGVLAGVLGPVFPRVDDPSFVSSHDARQRAVTAAVRMSNVFMRR